MSTSARAFSIKIFLPGGNPGGVRIIEKSLWTGVGVVFPRILLDQVQSREEFSRAGVYVLAGPSDDSDSTTLYIGEGDPIGPRLLDHHKKKDFWTWALFFTAKDGTLNKAHIQHLEARLIRLVIEVNRATLENKQEPTLPTLSESDEADVDNFLTDMRSIFPLVGLSVFEKPTSSKTRRRDLLHINRRGTSATGYESTEGFVILKGAQTSKEPTASFATMIKSVAVRDALIQRGVLRSQGGTYELTVDYVFSSPSQAAEVVLASSANGRVEWKNEYGQTLKALQEAS